MKTLAFALAVSLSLAVQAFAQTSHILVLQDDPAGAVFILNTQVRHTTVLTLPAGEQILDFVVGDSEYWHLSGAANVAFLKPIAEDVATNVALVCESGRIYSFLVSESDADPHLVVRVNPPGGADGNTVASADGAHRPAFVAADRIESYQLMAQQAAEAADQARQQADEQIAAAEAEAAAQVTDFRSDYPTRLQFPYTLDNDAADWPFLVQAMWHDGEFTYLRSYAQETPALYERVDGQPSIVAYDVDAERRLYIVRRIIGAGWLQLGRERVEWRFAPAPSAPIGDSCGGKQMSTRPRRQLAGEPRDQGRRSARDGPRDCAHCEHELSAQRGTRNSPPAIPPPEGQTTVDAGVGARLGNQVEDVLRREELDRLAAQRDEENRQRQEARARRGPRPAGALPADVAAPPTIDPDTGHIFDPEEIALRAAIRLEDIERGFTLAPFGPGCSQHSREWHRRPTEHRCSAGRNGRRGGGQQQPRGGVCRSLAGGACRRC